MHRKKIPFYLFITLVVVHLTVLLTFHSGNDMDQVITGLSKALLMPSLLFCFISSDAVKNSAARLISLAIICSWIGDVLLIFQERNSLFFIGGLTAFLLAHIFYTLFFRFVLVREAIPFRYLLLLPVLLYYAVVMYMLSPYLGQLRIPVYIYGIVITAMLLLALQCFPVRKPASTGNGLPGGALLFVTSDTILAVNKFYQPFPSANVLIMATYCLAQLLIVWSASGYLLSMNMNSFAHHKRA